MREVLEKQYTYVPLEPRSDPASTARALDDALTDAVRSDTEFTVIHLLAHGDPAENIDSGLHVVGGDGRRTETLARWVNIAEGRTPPDDDGPAVLLILDLCHSGAVAAGHLRSLVRPQDRRVWVLAACPSDEPAYDGRLSLAVDEVLRGFASGALSLDESMPYIPIDKFCLEVAKHVEEQSAGSVSQTVERPLAALGTDLSHLRFFPNPRYDPDARRNDGGVDPAVFALLDEVADTRHFVTRAHGGNGAFGDLGAPAFTGRGAELLALTHWLEGTGPSLRVVTGVPGVGKSALIGTVVCAAHPALREPTEKVWRQSGGDLPASTDGLAIVHARRRTISDVLGSIASQWKLDSPSQGRSWTTDQLVAALRTRDRPPYLIVDAVDEAERPADLVTAVLLPLAATTRADGSALCRMLVATRREEEALRLIELAGSQGGLTDLDSVPASRLRKDLVRFVCGVLRPLGHGARPWCSLEDAESLGHALADTLLSGPRTWGEFLVAGLYLRVLQERGKPPATTAEAKTLGRNVPRTLDAVLDLDIGLMARPGSHELLAALAWAEGAGIPEDLLAKVAGVRPAPPGENHAAVSELLRAARFYVRRNVDREGTPLYRLFHQGLADRLRERPVLDAATVWERLLSTVRTTDSGRRRWANAEPYLLRHAARHSALAGCLSELLEDSDYLVHADPAPLAAELYRGQRSTYGAVYLTSYGAHHDGPPDQRRDILAIDAVRHQQWRLAGELSRDTRWRIRWTAGRALPTGLLTTLTGHRGGIWDMATLVMHGRHHALTASEDGTARLWDLDSATATLDLNHHGSPVTCVVVGEVDGRHLAVTGCYNGDLTGWDLTTGHLLWTATAHDGPVGSMVGVRYEGVPAAASGGEDHAIHYWELATGRLLSTTRPPEIFGAVWQLSTTIIDGVGESVAACYDGRVVVLTVHGDTVDIPVATVAAMSCHRFLDLGHGTEPVAGDDDGLIWAGPNGGKGIDTHHADAITDLTAVSLGGSRYLLSTGKDGLAQLTATTPGGHGRRVASHTTEITRVAVVPEPSRTRILTASAGGTVRVSDAEAREVWQSRPGHTHAIKGLMVLADGRPVSCSEDGTIALWSADAQERQTIFLVTLNGYRVLDRPTGIAVLGEGAAPLIVAAGALAGIAVWDTSTEEPRLEERVLGDGCGVSAVVTVTVDGVLYVIYASDNRGVVICSARHTEWMSQPSWDVAGSSWSDAGDRVLLTSAMGATCLAASPTHVVAGYDSGHVRSASLLGPPSPHLVTDHPTPVHTVAIADIDEQPYAISGDDQGNVRVTALDATRKFSLTGHTRAVFATTPVLLDGRPHLLTGGLDRTLRLWDLRSGGQLDVFWFPDTVFAIAVAPDGSLYVGVGPDIIHMAPDDQHLSLRPYPAPDQGNTAP
ncbi:hypothetical protein ACIRJS_11065 [Streptomyces sp. NPDC102340]|uniref:hypothetical protein n=1 Tax=unclassified Streptomyces TaxID=2593676 RepID=UPI003824D093